MHAGIHNLHDETKYGKICLLIQQSADVKISDMMVGVCRGTHLEEALLEAALHECLPGRQAAGVVGGQACQQRRHQRLLHCLWLLPPATNIAAVDSRGERGGKVLEGECPHGKPNLCAA